MYLSHKYNNPKWNDLYRIQFNGKKNLEVFRSKVGFCNPKHGDRYNRYVNKLPINI